MNFLDNYIKIENEKTYKGLTKELNIFCVLKAHEMFNKNTIVLTNTLYEANLIYKDLLTHNNKTLLYPMDELVSFVADAISPELKITRLETLEKIKNENNNIIVTNLFGFLKKVSKEKFKNKNVISVNMNINRNKLVELLEDNGYSKETLVTSTGEYAVRGYVVDIFLFREKHPIRIEFFGDEIESIRYFDESTQLSKENIKEIEIKPVDEIDSEEMISLYEYCENPLVVLYNYQQLLVSSQKLSEDIIELKENSKLVKILEFDKLNIKEKIYIESLDNYNSSLRSNEIDNFGGDFDLLKKCVDKWLTKNYHVIFCLSKDSQIKIIKDMFGDNVCIEKKKINKGFIIDKYVVISEYDIDRNLNVEIKYRNNFHLGRKIKDYEQLEIGDYIVHSTHGIGVYNGLITLEKNGLKKDYIQLNYLGNDKIYIPVEKISNIYKYSSKDGVTPKLNKLNSVTWSKTKNSVRKKIKDISEELIKLYAARAAIKGDKYKNYEEEEIFANSFIYDETEDQLKAIKEIDADLQDSKPMDRLLCGDVGFGKTEVAFRAMFKTVLNNKQVFYLCPTTILSKQQYESAINRFKDYAIEIALLNRFTSKKEATKIIEGLKKGTIDIVIGTHRLLSKDISFKDLGLLVIDEEQRFGVTHKERLKEYKKDVNVLTLSATPIPRTMKMAMSGLRDLTIIDTPPINRYPVQTYVMAENDFILKDAIYKEISRNGQVFILFNNISLLDSKKDMISKIVPEARIVCAHGKLTKTELDNIMSDFISHKYDILLCTTIIETGIDIPNANTLIVFDADHFGLSQLYQLRGRVGRSDKIAFAYLFYDQRKMLNDIAVKRLNAIKEFTELGSGYRIAMRDLSIRGAGDLLGSEQAGFVDAVGISLYMKMVDDEVRRRNGEEIDEDEDKNSLIEVETHISDNYVSDEDLKIEIHKKINEIDSYESLVKVKDEIEDRFGKISESILIYMYEEWFEKLAKKLNITRVNQNERLVEVELPEDVSSNIKGDKLFLEAYAITPKFQLKYFNKRIIISLPIKQVEKHFLIYFIPLLDKIIKQIN